MIKLTERGKAQYKSHTFRPRAKEGARLISMISDSKTLSRQNSPPSVQQSHVSVELEKTLS